MWRDLLDFIKLFGGVTAVLGFIVMVVGIIGHCNHWDVPDWTLHGVFAMFIGGLVFILVEIGNN